MERVKYLLLAIIISACVGQNVNNNVNEITNVNLNNANGNSNEGTNNVNNNVNDITNVNVNNANGNGNDNVNNNVNAITNVNVNEATNSNGNNNVNQNVNGITNANVKNANGNNNNDVNNNVNGITNVNVNDATNSNGNNNMNNNVNGITNANLNNVNGNNNNNWNNANGGNNNNWNNANGNWNNANGNLNNANGNWNNANGNSQLSNGMSSINDYSTNSKYTGRYRPCPNLDLYCIRKYFSKNAECKISKKTVPEPLKEYQMNAYLPFFNITVTMKDVYYYGLASTFVQDFYVNRDTDRAVLTLSFQNVSFNSSSVYFRYHRNRKEPAVTKTTLSAFFPSFTTTTVFRLIKHLEFDTSETHAFVDAYKVKFGPEVDKYPDPVVKVMFAVLAATPKVSVQEYFLTAAQFYAANYIQYSMCDFGYTLL